MKSLKSLVRVSGVIIMFYIVINFYWFLFVAMLDGGGVVTIYFNHLNEGLIELIMYIMLIPLIVASFVLEIKQYSVERRKRE